MDCARVALATPRAASSYGEHVTTKLAYDLADKGVPVVSGGAYGTTRLRTAERSLPGERP